MYGDTVNSNVTIFSYPLMTDGNRVVAIPPDAQRYDCKEQLRPRILNNQPTWPRVKSSAPRSISSHLRQLLIRISRWPFNSLRLSISASYTYMKSTIRAYQ